MSALAATLNEADSIAVANVSGDKKENDGFLSRLMKSIGKNPLKYIQTIAAVAILAVSATGAIPMPLAGQASQFVLNENFNAEGEKPIASIVEDLVTPVTKAPGTGPGGGA